MGVVCFEFRGWLLFVLFVFVLLVVCLFYVDVECDVVVGGCGLVKFNLVLKQVYELVLIFKDVFGLFVIVEGVVQYDVSNYEDCGWIIWFIGMVGCIISQELVELCRMGENEYRGMFYFDCMQDQDYYDCGMCYWMLIGVGVMLCVMNGEVDM